MVEKAGFGRKWLTAFNLLQTLIVKDPKQKGQEYQVSLKHDFNVARACQETPLRLTQL